MSPTKGVRKRKETRPTGLRFGNRVVPSQVIITGLMALLYAWLVLGGAYERDNLLMQGLFFALFLGVLYLLVMVQKTYSRAGIAFFALAIPPLLWNLAVYFGFRPAVPDLAWFLYAGLASLLLSAALAVAILWYGKEKPSAILVRGGNLKPGLLQGFVMLVVSALLAAVAAYTFYGAGSADVSRLLPASGALLAFGVAAGCAEELLFRGLLLSRLLPLVKDTPAIIVQAFAFAVYEGAFFYLLTADPVYALAVSVIAAALGAVWAWMALRDRNIAGPALSHAGIYLVLALPIFSAFF